MIDGEETTAGTGTGSDSGSSRRALLVGAGAAGVTALLTGCAEDAGSPAPPAAPPAPGSTTGAPDGGAQALAKTSEVPVSGGKVFAQEGVVVTQPASGTFKAFSATCTHQGCPVANVEGGTINCTCHGSKFSIEDGSVKNGPATKGLAEKQVTVSGDSITLA